MYRFLSLLLFALGGLVQAQNVNTTLLANINNYANNGYTDVWGYTAPDGRHYALQGVNGGVMIVDVTDVMDRTFEAIRAYTSQMQVARGKTGIERILKVVRAHACLLLGVEYAEALTTELPLNLDADAFFRY